MILAGDRGLCGSYNASVFKEATKFLRVKEAEGVKVSHRLCIGKKAYDFFRRRGANG